MVVVFYSRRKHSLVMERSQRRAVMEIALVVVQEAEEYL